MPEEDTRQPRRIYAGVLAFILWIATAALGLLDILAVRNILIGIYGGAGGRDYWAAVNVANWAMVVVALVWIAVVVGGGEYHRSRVGQRSSWKLFGWTLCVEVAILILSLFI